MLTNSSEEAGEQLTPSSSLTTVCVTHSSSRDLGSLKTVSILKAE